MRYVLFFICLTTSLFSISQQDAELAFLNGNKAFGEKNFEEALQFYQTASSFGKSAQVYFNLGQTYIALKKPGFALAYFLKAEKIDPHWQLLRQTIDKFYKTNTNFPTYDQPWYQNFFKLLSNKTWYYLGSTFFWISCWTLLYTIAFKRNKYVLYFMLTCIVTTVLIFSILSINRKFNKIYILPETSSAHFAPTQQSPVRHTWAMGTQLWIKSKHQSYCFVKTLQGEDGWVNEEVLIPLQ